MMTQQLLPRVTTTSAFLRTNSFKHPHIRCGINLARQRQSRERRCAGIGGKRIASDGRFRTAERKQTKPNPHDPIRAWTQATPHIHNSITCNFRENSEAGVACPNKTPAPTMHSMFQHVCMSHLSSSSSKTDCTPKRPIP